MGIAGQTNNFLKHYQYNHGLVKAISKPTIFAVESTNLCNLNCKMCTRREMKRPVGMMDFGLFRKIVDEAKKGGTEFLILHEMGEPLLHPKITEMIDYCEDNGIRAGISTNATLLTEKIGKKLLKSKLSEITLCMDGATKKTYEKIRQGANYETVKKNILRFLEMKKKSGNTRMKAIVQLIEMDETVDEKEKFLEEWKKTSADKIFFKKFSTWADQVEGIKELAGQKHRYMNKLDAKRPPCFIPWQSVVVLWDGKVVPCCIDFDGKIELGDLTKQTLAEIWNGEPMKKLRKSHIDRKFYGTCSNCIEYYSYATSKWYPVAGPFIAQLGKKLFKAKKGKEE